MGVGNVIGDNVGGIAIGFNAPLAVVTVQGNWIGTDKSGTIDLGNTSSGVGVGSDAIVGGIASGESNAIAFNDTGVVVGFSGTNPASAAIRGNSIYDNDGLGIDLANASNAADGVTANDPLDVDTGPNGLQNFPVISLAFAGAATEVNGTFGGDAGVTYQLDFYASETADSSGFGEGARYLGSLDVVGTGADENFAVTTLGTSIDGEAITATATRAGIETSEFSAAATAIDVSGPAILPGSLIVTVVPEVSEDHEHIDEVHLGLPVGTVEEGENISLTGIWASPGSNKSIIINWGDGTVTNSATDPVTITNVGFSAEHIYADDSPSGTAADDYEIRVIATDNTTGGSGRSTRMIEVGKCPCPI